MDFGTFGKVADTAINWIAGDSAANKNAELQKQFAKQGIRWRVADAQAAGVHPLYALGAQTHSFAPTHIGGDLGLSSMGQDISSAIDATRTAPEKVDAYTGALRTAQLERAGLENELLKSQIAMNRARGGAPMASGIDPFLMPGQVQSSVRANTVYDAPLKRSGVDPTRPHQEGAAIPEVGWARTATGGYRPVPSKDVKERIEDTFIPEMMWSLYNNIMPNFTGGSPPFKAPPGKYWRYNVLKQEYELVRD